MTFLATIVVIALLIAAQGLYRNWGRKTFDALPSNIDEPSEWIGKDHDKVWYTRWVKYVKGWFAVGPLSAYKWAQWREIPKVLFAVKGKGPWRWEYTTGGLELLDYEGPVLRDKTLGASKFYLSRVQYYTRWHFAVQWPLQGTFHIYWKEKDIPALGGRPSNMSLKKMLFIYGPTHRDADLVYWILSFFVGGTWK